MLALTTSARIKLPGCTVTLTFLINHGSRLRPPHRRHCRPRSSRRPRTHWHWPGSRPWEMERLGWMTCAPYARRTNHWCSLLQQPHRPILRSMWHLGRLTKRQVGWQSVLFQMTTRCVKYIPVRLLETRFTNTISCFEPGPQEPYIPIWLLFEILYKSVLILHGKIKIENLPTIYLIVIVSYSYTIANDNGPYSLGRGFYILIPCDYSPTTKLFEYRSGLRLAASFGTKMVSGMQKSSPLSPGAPDAEVECEASTRTWLPDVRYCSNDCYIELGFQHAVVPSR
jgi:hypothetical protein